MQCVGVRVVVIMRAGLTAGGVVAVVYHTVFTGLACAVMVAFFRRRDDFYLKARIPALSLAHMANCMIEWILVGIALPLVTSPSAHCYISVVWNGFFCCLLVFMHVVRAWSLYWKIFLTKHLQRSRDLVLENFERRRPSNSESTSKSVVAVVHTRIEVVKYRVARYAIVGYFTILLFLYVFFLHYEAVRLKCVDMSVSVILLLVIVPSAMAAAAFLGWSLRNFKDNFRIYIEIRYTVISYCVCFPLVLGLVIHAELVNQHTWVIVIGLTPYLAQLTFVLTCALPLIDQRKLDQKVKQCDFDGLDTLEDVLAQPAALVALEQFMRHEFTEEVLEFYETVVEFKERHGLWTPEKRLRIARVVYSQFVAPGAPSQINVSDRLLKEIELHVFGPSVDSDNASTVEDVPSSTFDAAQAEMAKLIRTGPLLRFQLLRAHGDLPNIDPALARRSQRRRFSTRSNQGSVSISRKSFSRRKSLNLGGAGGLGLGTIGPRSSVLAAPFDLSAPKSPSSSANAAHSV